MLKKSFVKIYKSSMISYARRRNNIGKEKMLSRKKNNVRIAISTISRMTTTTGVVELMHLRPMGRCGGVVVNEEKMH